MATASTPAASSQTKPNNQGGVTPVTVTPPRRVTYIFKTTSSRKLQIPYAVAVDNTVLPEFAKKPRRVSGDSGKVTVTVLQGQRVHLYLNSDAAVGFRSEAVYALSAGDRDAEVTITEKEGKHTDSDTPVQEKSADAKVEAAKKADTYSAPLTGDIWMKVSHKYTSAEVDALMPAGTAPEAVAAIKSIYEGLSQATLYVSVAARGGQPARQVSITFQDANNPKNNISNYRLLTDGLPRVHPAGYAALVNAAIENNITTLTVSSCWRPMVGSIAHRAGLGLDVVYVGASKMNREELRDSKKPSDNVTDAEIKAFAEFERSIVGSKKAKAESVAANKALAAAQKSGDAAKIEESKKRANDTQQAAQKAFNAEIEKRDQWNNERNAAEPDNARLFRASLLRCACVTQLFDPWFMDANTKDGVAPEPNMQRGASTSNERLHAHHLHITVSEPRIL